MSRNRWLIVFIALVVAWQLWTHRAPQTIDTPAPTTRSATLPGAIPIGSDRRDRASTHDDSARHPPASITEREPAATAHANERSALPAEALATLQLIRDGGPFPYDRDGIVFGNFERRLPKQNRGYYHEYTVPTPGLSHRGVRRIIAGGKPPSEFWYTGDHYETFQRIGDVR